MKSPLPRNLILIIGLGLLLPVVTFSVFQLAQLNRDEARIRAIYQRQLETILFSINQDFWDRYSGWINSIAALSREKNTAALRTGMLTYLSSTPAVHTVALYRYGENPLLLAAAHRTGQGVSGGVLPPFSVSQAMTASGAEIAAAVARVHQGYRNPVITDIAAPGSGRASLLLTPVISDTDVSRILLIAIGIDHARFLEAAAAPKFREMAESGFTLAVEDSRNDRTLLMLSPAAAEEKGAPRELRVETADPRQHGLRASFEQSAPLWILPDQHLLIKPRGTSLQHVSSARRRQSLISIILVNGTLLAGILVLLRAVSGEIRLARMKTDFVANVSHELRTPLSLIRLHAETLEMKRVRGDEKKLEYYRIIRNESIRLGRMIDTILDFSRMEARKKRYRFAPERLQDLVHETADLTRFSLEQQGFILRLDIDAELPPVVLDREAVLQALDNLISNAVRYSAGRKEITISLKKDGRLMVLSVADRGIGIPEYEQKKIFDKFYRVEGSLTASTRGTGIGLSLVRSIMEAHCGSVSVHSRPGEGSTFSLVFPAVGPKESQ
ncbi:HAMP domain-containing histidine kinase [bacterium]|nr:HAMP domain-containing histidine kinase [bacterium]